MCLDLRERTILDGQFQIDDVERQMVKLRVALPVWGTEANDLIELARNVERAAMKMDDTAADARATQVATGWHGKTHVRPSQQATMRTRYLQV